MKMNITNEKLIHFWETFLFKITKHLPQYFILE
jgi:hypothetical protein